ncbi:MAG TPA: diacylglycerol kinase family protein, partial [Dehalococcoidia bacterium]|nr:diacylglycerol kinase family protein [Dehalococcoidia bacterium]
MRRARIVYNPAARNAPSLDRLQAAMRQAAPGWELDLVTTEEAGHATSLAREAAEAGFDLVIACGGDGTINETANGLAGSGTALGVLRGGMGDVFAKEAGIPKSPERALAALLQGQRRRFDLGTANGRYFLLMAGAGLDAEVVRRVPDAMKRRLGSTSYVLWGLRLLPGYRPRRVTVRMDGEERECHLFWVLLGNTRSYGGAIDITRRAVVDDGLLDAYVFDGKGLGWAALTGLRIALRRHDGTRGVHFRRLRTLQLDAPGIPV